MAKRKKRKSPVKAAPLDVLEQISPHAAGLDIGAEEIYACVPVDRDEQSVRLFPTFTVDLHALADWLAACQIETVAMESTGVYWIPVYEILEARGFEVYLVNARHVKNVTGRKSDVLDCQWIQQLHTYGLLSASFRPDEQIRTLRADARHRENLIRYRSSHIQHMHKAIQLMNLQLNNVISDITGQTGMQILRAIVAGERDPLTLARFRDPRCRSSEAEIAKALSGHYRVEYVFMLQQALQQYDFYSHQIQACDQQLEQHYATFEAQVDLESQPLPQALKRRGRSDNAPAFDLRTYLYQMCGVDLTQIDGIDTLTVQTVISEIGLDLSKFKTVKHFASWLGLAPYKDISGGKVLKTGTNKTKNRAAKAFRMAAQSLSRSQSALGGFYRRIRAKYGGPVAVTATAHKLARIFYHMLKHRQAYVDPGQDAYQQQYQQRVVKNLKRKAKELGFDLVPQPGVS